MPNTQRIYIGNLAPDCRERDLEKLFKAYGKLGEVIVRNDFGFVDFDDSRDADDAVADLDGQNFLGKRIRVELAKGNRDRRSGGGFGGRRSPPRRGGFGDNRWRGPPGRTPRTSWRLIVDNISSRTSWQDLKDYFRSSGDVNYCTANKIANGKGMVEFVDRRGMENALDRLNNTELDGRTIRLEEEGTGTSANRGWQRSPRRSRTRSPSPARKRGRSRSPFAWKPTGGRQSRSPRRSRSPNNRKSRSPVSRRSRSVDNRRSRSPAKRKSVSPSTRRSTSPANRRSTSPGPKRSKSPKVIKRRSRSISESK